MKRKIALFLLLVASALILVSCSIPGIDGGKGVFEVDFDTEGQMLTTSMTEDDLREFMAVTFTSSKGKVKIIEDYTISCAFTEGKTEIKVSWKDYTWSATEFFFDTEKFVNEGDFVFYSYNDKPYLFRYNGNAANLVLPEKADTYAIFEKAFMNNKSLVSVDLGDSVSSIGEEAFSGCEALMRVDLGKNVKTVCYGAFTACEKLNYVGVDSVEQWCNIEFNKNASYANGLNNSNVITFDKYDSSLNLQNGTVGSFSTGGTTTDGMIIYNPELSVQGSVSLGPVYQFNQNLINSVFFVRPSVETYGDTVLYTTVANSDLNGDNAQNGLKTEYENGIIYHIDADGNRVSSERLAVSNPLFYARSLYVGGQKLENLVIPENVIKINAHAFAYTDIKSVTLHDNVNSVGNRAFYMCDKIERFSVAAYDMSFGNQAFEGTHVLTEYENCRYLSNGENPYYMLVSVRDKKDSLSGIHPDTVAIANDALGKTQINDVVLPDGLVFFGKNNRDSSPMHVRIGISNPDRWFVQSKEIKPLTECVGVEIEGEWVIISSPEVARNAWILK